jgi:urease accessory protein
MRTVTPTRTDRRATSRLRVSRRGVLEAAATAPLAQRRLRDVGDGAIHVAIVQAAAMLVDGDDVRVEVSVGPDAALVLSDISATVAHPMHLGARWRMVISAAPGARVVVREQPLIVADGAIVRRELTIEAAPGARVLHRETLVLGRHGERGGAVCARTRVTRSGRALLDDTLDTSQVEALRSAAVLGTARVAASLAAFGCELEPAGFLLGAGDQLVRRLASDMLGLGDIDALERRWRAAVLARGG